MSLLLSLVSRAANLTVCCMELQGQEKINASTLKMVTCGPNLDCFYYRVSERWEVPGPVLGNTQAEPGPVLCCPVSAKQPPMC